MKVINGSGGGGSIFCTRIISTVKSAELGGDRISWDLWCDVAVLRAHVPTEDKNSD